MSSPLIEARNLCKSYKNENVLTPAVCGVSFTIEEGEFVSIMGPSGSGKSTLMQLLGFLEKLSEGEYYFKGRSFRDFSEDELADIRNKKIGFVFQTFNLLPRATVKENVELPLLYNRTFKEGGKKEEKIMKALEAVGLEQRANYFSNQLSGGEKQRVAIARALVNEPEVIFADEPTGNLDSKNGIVIMEIFQQLNNKGKTVILVTHETFTAEHAKRIILMRDGKIIKDYPVARRRIAHDGEILK